MLAFFPMCYFKQLIYKERFAVIKSVSSGHVNCNTVNDCISSVNQSSEGTECKPQLSVRKAGAGKLSG